MNNRYLPNELVKREMNVTTRFLVLDLLYGPSLTAQIPLFRNYRILMDHAVSPEPRGFRENGWRHDDLHSRISINSKFGLFWSLSTILPGTALRIYDTNKTISIVVVKYILFVMVEGFPISSLSGTIAPKLVGFLFSVKSKTNFEDHD